MGIETFTFKLLLLFLPGVIVVKIIELLTPRKNINTYQYLINVFILGFVSYGTYGTIIEIIEYAFNRQYKVSFFTNIFSQEPVNFSEILYVAIVATIIGFTCTYAIKRRTLYRFAKWANISNKYGNGDVWCHLMNSDDVQWVTIRDLSNKRNYQGWVELFNDDEGCNREVLLRDVEIFDDTSSVPIDKVEGFYFPKIKDDYIIQIHLKKEDEKNSGTGGDEGE